MKSKLLLLIFTVITCLSVSTSHAQTRYQDSIFAAYSVTSVPYSVYGDSMDIYQPTGDVQATRPLIVLAHGGSFVAGNRSDDITITRLCADLAHKGYVTVSIDYRLASNPGNLLNGDSAATEVFEAVGDGKAAVRYFYKDASTTNTYKIDTNNIFIGGNSAGAVLFMHYAYLDDVSKLSVNPDFPSIADSVGGLEGKSGNPGYSTNIKGVINLAGGLKQADWLSYCGKPVVSAQGDSDQVVPYTCNEPYVYGFHVPLTLCGLGSLQPLITVHTPFSASLVFPGAGHVPWASNDTDFYMVDTLVTSFLYAEVTGTAPTSCGPIPAGIQNVKSAEISVYPNPTSGILNVQSSQYFTGLSMTDMTGRTMMQTTGINTLNYQMNVSGLSSGIYFVSVYSTPGQSPIVKKITIE